MKQEPEGFKPVWQQICDLVEAHSAVICSVDGCDKPRELRQYCGMHYARLKKLGLHPKDEPRLKSSPSHYAFAGLLAADTDECIDWPHTVSDGYPYLTFKSRPQRVHVLVCEAINGASPTEKHEVAHECGNSRCCNWRHLSWKTHAENLADKYRHGTMLMGERHHQSRLTEPEVIEIRASRNKISRTNLAKKFGVGRSTIDNVLDRYTWRHLP